MTTELPPAATLQIQDRVLNDMGRPFPSESKEWLREYAQRVAVATNKAQSLIIDHSLKI